MRGSHAEQLQAGAKKLKAAGADASSLGLAIGFEYGPMNVTRLGIKGGLIRCSASRAVLRSEDEQKDCSGVETKIGPEAYRCGSAAVRELFGTSRKRANLDYATGVDELSKKNDKAARATKLAESNLLQAASSAIAYTSPSQRTIPNKPAGFA